MTGHTPGPWHVRTIDGSVGCVDAGSAGDFQVAQAQEVSVKDRLKGGPERKANARLIAAAPELLAALIALADVVQAAIHAGDWNVDGACDPEMDRLRAEAAIAKATGETK